MSAPDASPPAAPNETPPLGGGPSAADESEHPLHVHLAGAIVRAALGTVGAAPIALYALVDDGPRRTQAAGLVAWFLVLGGILQAERRGTTWWRAAFRLAVGGLLGAVAALCGWVWVEALLRAGGPQGGYSALTRLFEERGGGGLLIVGVAVMGALLSPLLGVLFYVRNRTERLGPQVAAGVVTVVWLAALLLSERSRDATWCGRALLVCGALVPLGLWLGDRVATRWGRTPALAPGGEPRVALVVGGTLAVLCVALPAHALGGMQRPTTPAAVLREVDEALQRLPDGGGDHDRDLTRAFGLGAVGGYVYRLTPDPRLHGRGWLLAADPACPGLGKHLVARVGVDPWPRWAEVEEAAALDAALAARLEAGGR